MTTDADRALAQAALQYNLITVEQLQAAEQLRTARGVPLAAVLLERGLITVEQLAAFEKFQQSGPAAPAAQPAPVAQAAPVVQATPAAAAPTTPIGQLLMQAVQWRASDVHIHAGAKAKMRIAGTLRDVGDAPISQDAAKAMLTGLLDAPQLETLERLGEVDFAYTVEGVGRFRSNVYRQQRGHAGIFRVAPVRPPTLAELGLPELLASFTEYHQGLVLLTGPSGCGKSATLAALVNLINEKRADHILCIEDPIECLHLSRRSTVNQRQVGYHTKSFGRALRAALREDPDVIAIGELRDLETVSLALSAAETGHLVLATLHTESAIRTINRLVGVFPPNQQSQIRTMIADSLRAIVSQRLVTKTDGQSRVAAVEILIVTKAISNLIRDARTHQIQDAMQIGTASGMCLLDQSLNQLLEAGVITRTEALRHANDPKRIQGGEA